MDGFAYSTSLRERERPSQSNTEGGQVNMGINIVTMTLGCHYVVL